MLSTKLPRPPAPCGRRHHETDNSYRFNVVILLGVGAPRPSLDAPELNSPHSFEVRFYHRLSLQ